MLFSYVGECLVKTVQNDIVLKSFGVFFDVNYRITIALCGKI